MTRAMNGNGAASGTSTRLKYDRKDTEMKNMNMNMTIKQVWKMLADNYDLMVQLRHEMDMLKDWNVGLYVTNPEEKLFLMEFAKASTERKDDMMVILYTYGKVNNKLNIIAA